MRSITNPFRAGALVIMTAVLTVIGTPFGSAPARAAHPGSYRAVELDVSGMAYDVNDARQVIGDFLDSDGHPHPFLWERGRLTDLGTLRPGPDEFGYASDINNRGQVVGQSAVAWGDEDVTVHAFLWQRGVMTDLGTLGGEESWATAVNDRGQVFGVSDVRPGEWHGFRWERGVMTDLGTFRPSDANDRGQAAGVDDRTDESEPVLWDRGRTVPLGFGFGSADAINDAGWVAGFGYDDMMITHAYLWRSGVVTDLGTLGGASTASDINDHGVVLGHSDNGAFLWRAGTMTDLTAHGIVGDWPGVTALNNHGDLAGGVPSADGADTHPVLYRFVGRTG